MTIIALLMLLFPEQWHTITGQPIQSPATCSSALAADLRRCEILYPDAASLVRRVCVTEANGRYTACMGWLP